MPTGRMGWNPVRLLAALVVAVLVAGFSVAALQAPARAASNEPPVFGYRDNRFFTYLQAGEYLDTEGRIGTVTAPDGTVAGTGEGRYGPAETDGVWRVHAHAAETNEGYSWRVEAQDAAGTEIPGRVWISNYDMRQTSADAITDLDFWVVNDTGYLYELTLAGYNGINSVIEANSVGYGDEDCAPTYRSHETDGFAPDCGDYYRIFFEEPAADLPETAQSPNGEVYVLPDVLAEEDLTVSDLAFAPAALGSSSGVFSWTMTERYQGAYWLQVDVDGDGTYTGERDRSILMGADGSGSYEQEFDGLDGLGEPLSTCVEMNARIYFDRLGEVHVLQTDVEARGNGIEITRLNGAGAPDSTIYWDDTQLTEARDTETWPGLDGTAGVDSTGGTHGWDYDVNGWGNERVIDDWAYLPVDHSAAEITFGGSCLELEKTSTAGEDTRPGDVVTYEVTATNTGDADYTEAAPAVVLDDLSAVLDDGELVAGTVDADRDGTLDATDSLISWTGPLAAGDSVTITYDVVLAAGGDGALRNVAWEPFNPNEWTPPACDPPTDEGRDPVTGEPCAVVEHELPRLSITKTADRTELPALGEELTYTVTVTSEGPGDFTADAPATFTDDLSDVLDDADLLADSVTASVGEATVAGTELSWQGPLAAGESATVTYTVSYTAAGDQVLDNLACIPEPDALDPAAACDIVSVPGPDLSWAKSVDPASGTSVEAGEELTYTLSFSNDGEATATVDTTDDLSGVLDDAELVSGPTADDGLSATLDGGVLAVTGSVPAGETRTVTYTVAVEELSAAGDGVLTNTLACPAGTPEPCVPNVTENPVRALAVDKSADPAEGVDTGDVVTYTVTVTNTGEGDYTSDRPALVVDDMTGVLDDAVYLDDATAPSGDLVWEAPELTWTGALAAGESVEITYSVQVTNLGDHVLANAAGPVCATELCPPPTEVIVPLPYITPDKTSDPETGSELQAGDVVTYLLTWTNTGEADGRVDSTDDLAGVLDDAVLTEGPEVLEGEVSAEVAEDGLRVEGDLAPGETAAVSYTVTVLPDGERGDNLLGNVLVPDTPQVDCAAGECTTVPPPSTEHPVGELSTAKSADPASGTTVRPGEEVTYTLTFTNTGWAPVDVDREDVLTDVLDDAELVTGPVASDDTLEVTGPDAERITVTGSLDAGQEETVSYTVRVLPDGERGDDRLGNVLLGTGEVPPETCEAGDPNCTVHHVSDLEVTKSADPETGSTVLPGEEVTYVLTFTNTSTNPDAEPAPVAYTDHMADVLDDAALTAGPSVDGAGVEATVSDELIVITGAVAPGESAVVSYTVTVDDEVEGDATLANVVAPTGEEPVCAEGSPLCTSHDVEEPTPTDPGDEGAGGVGLPRTGADVLGAAAAAVLLLVAGGAALARRRPLTER